MKTWLIVGASRGIGYAIAKAALERGDKVAVTSRNLNSLRTFTDAYPEQAFPFALEVTNSAQCQTVVHQAIEAMGSLDVLVNNAGYILLGAMEENTEQEARDEMEVLFWGPWYLTKAALPYMRQRRSGTIVQMSSLAGVGGLPGNTMYAASKYALEGMSMALAQEMAPFQVRVIVPEPAGIRTSIGSSIKISQPIPAYDPIIGEQRQRWQSGEDATAQGDADLCAKSMLELVDMENPPLHIPWSAKGYELTKFIFEKRLAEVEAWKDMSESISIY